jgi:inorganic pyrophosphatase
MAYKNIPFGEVEAFNVLIEISQGSSNKYEYDEELDEIKLDFVFWGECKFPDNYGLVPETLAGDGDHLDAIVLNPTPLEVGTVVACRAVGILETIDRGEVDNKLVVVPVCCKEYEKIQSVEDLSAGFEEKYTKFYGLVGSQKNKKIEMKGLFGKEKAIEELNSNRIKK